MREQMIQYVYGRYIHDTVAPVILILVHLSCYLRQFSLSLSFLKAETKNIIYEAEYMPLRLLLFIANYNNKGSPQEHIVITDDLSLN